MPIIIDGWNLIRDRHSRIDDEDDSLSAATALVMMLERFQATHSDPVVIVFDSRSGFLDIPHRNTAKLAVVASRNADEYIKKYIAQVPERQRRNVRVVSSDKSVYYFAKTYSATPLKAQEFWAKLTTKRPQKGEDDVSGRDNE